MIAPATSEPARRTIEELDRQRRLAELDLLNAATYQSELGAAIIVEPDRLKRSALTLELRKAEKAAATAREKQRAIIREIAARGGRPKGFRDF